MKHILKDLVEGRKKERERERERERGGGGERWMDGGMGVGKKIGAGKERESKDFFLLVHFALKLF
jgi:hypothetical protein